MRKYNSSIRTAFISEAGNQLRNNDYFGFVELDKFACYVIADGITGMGGAESASINSSGTQQERQKNMMAFLMSLSKLSRENNISFQKEEVELIFSVLKKYSTSDDIAKMQKISSFFHSR